MADRIKNACRAEDRLQELSLIAILKEACSSNRKGKTVRISFAYPEARVKECFLHYALGDAVRKI